MNISLNNKFLLVFIGVFIVSATFAMYVINQKWDEQSLAVEKSVAQKNGKIMLALYTAYLDKVKSQTREWSKWTDLYMQLDRASQYDRAHPTIFKNDMSSEGLKHAEIDYIAVLNKQGERIYDVNANVGDDIERDITSEMRHAYANRYETGTFFNRLALMALDPYNTRIFCGGHTLSNTLVFICAGNINTGQSDQKNNGVLILAKRISKNQLDNIENITQGNIEFFNHDNGHENYSVLPLDRIYAVFNYVGYAIHADNVEINIHTKDMFSHTTGHVLLHYHKTQNNIKIDKIKEVYGLLGLLLIVSLVFIYIYIQKFIVQRIVYIKNHLTNVIEHHEWSKKLNDKHGDEISLMCDRVNMLTDTIDIQIDRLQTMALIDSLTGIYNRRYYDAHAKDVAERLLKEYKYAAYILLDVDHFKKYNDIYGHQAGDNVLVDVAMLFKRYAEQKKGVVCRLGGEEFVMFIGCHKTNDIEKIDHDIQELFLVASIEHTGNEPFEHVTVSGGVVLMHGAIDIENAYNQADAALYLAKNNGRNQCVIL